MSQWGELLEYAKADQRWTRGGRDMHSNHVQTTKKHVKEAGLHVSKMYLQTAHCIPTTFQLQWGLAVDGDAQHSGAEVEVETHVVAGVQGHTQRLLHRRALVAGDLLERRTSAEQNVVERSYAAPRRPPLTDVGCG